MPLTRTSLLDDAGTPGVAADDFTPTLIAQSINSDSVLDPGEVWLYRATGTAVRGQYANSAAVEAENDEHDVVSDTDASHYYGHDIPGLVTVQKAVNAVNPLAPTEDEDANDAPGPLL